MPDLTNDLIDAWLSPATATLSPDDLAGFRNVIAHAATKVNSASAFDLAGVAYQLDTPGSTAWFVSAVKEAQPDFIEVKQDALIARLACCTTLAILQTDKSPAGLVSLLGQSASFVGGTPAEPELHAHVIDAQHRLAAAIRTRPPAWTAITKDITQLAAKEPAEGETEFAPLIKAITRLAQELDKAGLRADIRARLVDEEYESLWWSFAGRSVTDDVPWSDVTPVARRVVLAADELGARVRPLGPAVVKSLLATALAGAVDKEVTLGEVILAACEADVDLVLNEDRKLLPISSGASIVRRVGSDGTTWSDTLAKSETLKLNINTRSTALDAALQLFREVDIGAHLE